MATGDLWTNNSDALRIRTEPNVNSKSISAVPIGTTLTEIERDGDYIKCQLNIDNDGAIIFGWVNTTSMTHTGKENVVVNTITENKNIEDSFANTENGVITDITSIEDIVSMGNVGGVDDTTFSKMENVAGVFGLPYQFLPLTDVRLSDASGFKSETIGYEYADKIVQRMPMLLISPGKPSFMKEFSKSTRMNIAQQLVGFGGGDANSISESLGKEKGRYYTFEYKTQEYYSYVNPMCRIAARFLGIQDVRIKGTPLDMINWEEFTRSGISGIGSFTDFSAIPFYIDTDTSIHESYSNSTTQSLLASSVNSISDMGRELNFLMGYTSAATNSEYIRALDNNLDNAMDDVENTISKIMGSGNVLSNLAKHITNIVAGGRLMFPEIWSDSSFSRSYDCKFKFISPDPSKLSIYLNVLVPLFHLLGLVAPHTIEDNPNSYDSPFIIRAIYKGFFNIDMGIVTDMSVTKGAECQWTPEGVPTSIEVDMTIKDLYPAMSITPTTSTNFSYDSMNNMALMDYIANLCGVNMYKPETARIIDMWFTNNVSNRIADIPNNIWGGVMDKVQNLIMNIYR